MRVFFYLLLLVPCLLLASFAWDGLASGKLYYCSDSMCGPFDLIPPFVHPHTDDHYIAPVVLVWALWVALALLALAAPATVIAAATRIVNVGNRGEQRS